MSSIRKRLVGGKTRWDVTVTRTGAPRQSKTFSTKSAADLWTRETEREIERGAWRSTDLAERTTIGELVKRYRDEVLPTKRSRTWISVANMLIQNNLARLPLLAVSTEQIAQYRDQRLRSEARTSGPYGHSLKRAVSTQTARNEMGLLRRVIDHAMREWGLYLPAGNPVSAVRLPSMCKARDRRLTTVEFDHLLKCARASRSKILPTAIELAVETAMRREELCSLTWADVDMTRRVAHLHMTKNGESRDVPLSGRAIVLLSELVRPIRGGRVLQIKPCTLSHTFKRVCGRGGIKNLRWHDLRHEATSRLAERLGNDVMALAAVTGHKTLQMLKRYTHLRAEDLARRLA